MRGFSRIHINRRWFSNAAFIAVLWLAFLSPARAERSVTLAWNPSSDASVTGYCVYSREENSAAPVRLDVGTSRRATIPGLKEGLRYTFSVAAYNAAGVESAPSREVAFNVPVPVRIVQPALATSFRRVQFPIAPGHWYELQASTNLVNWSTIWQTGVANSYSWVDFQDPQSRTLKARFYRLSIH